MSNKEDFEDIIKSKFSEKQFSFDEENWEGAEELISSFRKKEKIKRGAVLFFSGLTLGVLVMLPFLNFDKLFSVTSADLVISNSIVTPKLQNGVGDEVNKKHTSPSVAKNSINDNSKQIDDIDIENNKPISSQQPAKTNDNTTSYVDKGNGEKTSNIVVENNANSLYAGNINSSRNPATKNKMISEKNVDAVISNESKTVQQDVVIGEIVKEKSDSISTVVSETIINEGVIAKIDSSLIITKDSLIATVDSIVAKDTNKVAEAAPKEKNSNVGDDKSRISVYALAGANYSNGFSTNSIEGLEFMLHLIPKISVGTGVLHTYLTIKSGAVKTIVTNTTYDFGYNADVTDIKTDKIHYVVIPAFVRFDINEKNGVVLGVNNYLLATVANTYSTYSESYGDKENVSSKKTYGYSSGINSYDMGIIAGYRRTVFNNFGVGLYFNFGLKDIKKDEYYNEDVFNRNISGQLVLTYKLH